VKPTDRVLAALHAGGVATDILEFPHSTRTAADAAAAVGTTVAQIVKSLVFLADAQPFWCWPQGRIAWTPPSWPAPPAPAPSPRRMPMWSMTSPDSPSEESLRWGTPQPLPVYIDRDLLGFEIVYAAAGTPTSVFSIAPVLLQRLTRGTGVDLREESERQS